MGNHWYQGFCELSSKEADFRVVLFNKNYRLNKIPTNQKVTEIVEFLSDGKLASRLEIQETMGLQKKLYIWVNCWTEEVRDYRIWR